jgi:hypothetical protein
MNRPPVLHPPAFLSTNTLLDCICRVCEWYMVYSVRFVLALCVCFVLCCRSSILPSLDIHSPIHSPIPSSSSIHFICVIYHGTLPRNHDADVDVVLHGPCMCPSFSALVSFLQAHCSGCRGRSQGCTLLYEMWSMGVIFGRRRWPNVERRTSQRGGADPCPRPVFVVVVVVGNGSLAPWLVPSRSRLVCGSLCNDRSRR